MLKTVIEIHESMLVKLPDGMTAARYVDAIKKGQLFPQGALDYSGPGLTSPGEAVGRIKVDPGHYVLICWNGDHATTVRCMLSLLLPMPRRMMLRRRKMPW